MTLVNDINKKLDGFGDKAISVDKYSPFGGIGYAWQYLCDAVNEVLGANGWRYDLVGEITVEEKTRYDEKKKKDVTTFYAEAMVKLYVSNEKGGGVCERGPTIGSCQNIGRGDAQKGAITDALKKGFSLFSIGNKAMRGDLGNNKKKSQPPKTSKPPAKSTPPAKDTPPDLPSDVYTDILTKIEDATKASDLKAIPNLIGASGLSDDDKANLRQHYTEKQTKLKK